MTDPETPDPETCRECLKPIRNATRDPIRRIAYCSPMCMQDAGQRLTAEARREQAKQTQFIQDYVKDQANKARTVREQELVDAKKREARKRYNAQTREKYHRLKAEREAKERTTNP